VRIRQEGSAWGWIARPRGTPLQWRRPGWTGGSGRGGLRCPVPARVGEREVRAVGDGVTTGGPHPV
jgi:hypothetical protein